MEDEGVFFKKLYSRSIVVVIFIVIIMLCNNNVYADSMSLKDDYNQLKYSYDKLEKKHDRLQEKYENLKEEWSDKRESIDEGTKELNNNFFKLYWIAGAIVVFVSIGGFEMFKYIKRKAQKIVDNEISKLTKKDIELIRRQLDDKQKEISLCENKKILVLSQNIKDEDLLKYKTDIDIFAKVEYLIVDKDMNNAICDDIVMQNITKATDTDVVIINNVEGLFNQNSIESIVDNLQCKDYLYFNINNRRFDNEKKDKNINYANSFITFRENLLKCLMYQDMIQKKPKCKDSL